MMLYGIMAVALLALLTATAQAQTAGLSANLVHNPQFQEGAGDAAAGWKPWRPLWEQAACRVRRTGDGLVVDGPEEPHAVGGAQQELSGLKGGQAYAIEATAALDRIATPRRSVMVRVTWTRKGQALHPAGMLVRGPVVEGGVARFKDVLVAPAEADAAQVSLEVKWPQGGQVTWQAVRVIPAETPAPRKAKIGTVYLRPKNSTPAKNLELWSQQVDAAGKLGLDLVCLGEAILVVGTGKTYADVAETIPGPTTEALGQVAARNKLYLVAGLFERDGRRLYNTAVLLDRAGKLVGKYRKIHLPREEWQKGITPGSDYPVFQTDFGVIGIQICYDWFFPEAAEAFALAGAEVLLAPTWGDTLADQDGWAGGETVFRTRARDNGLYLVPSVYDGQSMVIDPMGRILAGNRGKDGVFWAEVDLSRREPLPWVGHWRSIGPRDRMPETYGSLGPQGPR